MKAKHTWLTLIGMGLGLAAAYRVTRIRHANQAAGATFDATPHLPWRPRVGGCVRRFCVNPADIWSLRANLT
jgi:hypothetical protein